MVNCDAQSFSAPMNENAAACHRKALESERAAILATDVAGLLMYLDLAEQWRDMADQARLSNVSSLEEPE